MKKFQCPNCKRILETEDKIVCPAPCMCGEYFLEVKSSESNEDTNGGEND